VFVIIEDNMTFKVEQFYASLKSQPSLGGYIFLVSQLPKSLIA